MRSARRAPAKQSLQSHPPAAHANLMKSRIRVEIRPNTKQRRRKVRAGEQKKRVTETERKRKRKRKRESERERKKPLIYLSTYLWQLGLSCSFPYLSLGFPEVSYIIETRPHPLSRRSPDQGEEAELLLGGWGVQRRAGDDGQMSLAHTPRAQHLNASESFHSGCERCDARPDGHIMALRH